MDYSSNYGCLISLAPQSPMFRVGPSSHVMPAVGCCVGMASMAAFNKNLQDFWSVSNTFFHRFAILELDQHLKHEISDFVSCINTFFTKFRRFGVRSTRKVRNFGLYVMHQHFFREILKIRCWFNIFSHERW